MASRPSLVGRALAAVLLMIGFYALALIIIGPLVAVPIAEGRSLTPFADLAQVAQGKLTAEEWQATWQEIGLLNEDLEPSAARGTPSRPQSDSRPTTRA